MTWTPDCKLPITPPLDYVDSRMKSLGQSLNLLDPDGTFKGMPDEALFIKLMQAVRNDYRELSDAIRALRGLPWRTEIPQMQYSHLEEDQQQGGQQQ